MNEGVEAARFLDRKIIAGLEALDFTGDLRGIARCVKARDFADAGFTGGDV